MMSFVKAMIKITVVKHCIDQIAADTDGFAMIVLSLDVTRIW